MMARDAVLGRSNPWDELFDTGRTKVKGGVWDYLKENFDYPYYLIRDRFAGPEGKSLRVAAAGAGQDPRAERRSRSPPSATTTARSRCCRRSARTWAASWTGTKRSDVGLPVPRLAVQAEGRSAVGPGRIAAREASRGRPDSTRYTRWSVKPALRGCHEEAIGGSQARRLDRARAHHRGGRDLGDGPRASWRCSSDASRRSRAIPRSS